MDEGGSKAEPTLNIIINGNEIIVERAQSDIGIAGNPAIQNQDGKPVNPAKTKRPPAGIVIHTRRGIHIHLKYPCRMEAKPPPFACLSPRPRFR